MSLSHFRRPFDIAKHPRMEPEVKRSILASWASDAPAVEGRASLCKPNPSGLPVAFHDVISARKSLD